MNEGTDLELREETADLKPSCRWNLLQLHLFLGWGSYASWGRGNGGAIAPYPTVTHVQSRIYLGFLRLTGQKREPLQKIFNKTTTVCIKLRVGMLREI